MLVLEGEQSHFEVVPLLKQTGGKMAMRKSLEATRMGSFCSAMMSGRVIPVMKALGSPGCEGEEMRLC